jgi:hypothetical protein
MRFWKKKINLIRTYIKFFLTLLFIINTVIVNVYLICEEKHGVNQKKRNKTYF